MNYRNNKFVKANIMISPEEWREAKAYARSLGMTAQGWLGSLVKRELAAQEDKDEQTQTR